MIRDEEWQAERHGEHWTPARTMVRPHPNLGLPLRATTHRRQHCFCCCHPSLLCPCLVPSASSLLHPAMCASVSSPAPIPPLVLLLGSFSLLLFFITAIGSYLRPQHLSFTAVLYLITLLCLSCASASLHCASPSLLYLCLPTNDSPYALFVSSFYSPITSSCHLFLCSSLHYLSLPSSSYSPEPVTLFSLELILSCLLGKLPSKARYFYFLY